MLAHESLPKGGTIRVANGAGPNQFIITAEGPDAAPRAQVKEALERSLPAGSLDPRLVHPYVLSLLAAQYGFAITMDAPDKGKVTYTLNCPE